LSAAAAAAAAAAAISRRVVAAHKYELATDDAVVVLCDRCKPVSRPRGLHDVRSAVKHAGRNSINNPRYRVGAFADSQHVENQIKAEKPQL